MVDGNGTETGHIIATTIGGRNGQPKQVYFHLELWSVGKSSETDSMYTLFSYSFQRYPVIHVISCRLINGGPCDRPSAIQQSVLWAQALLELYSRFNFHSFFSHPSFTAAVYSVLA